MLGVPVGRAGDTMDHWDSPNCPTKNPPANYHLIVQHPCHHNRTSLSGMGRTRPPVGPTVDLAFNPSKDITQEWPSNARAPFVA